MREIRMLRSTRRGLETSLRSRLGLSSKVPLGRPLALLESQLFLCK